MQELQKARHGYKFVNFKPRYVKIEIPIDWYFSAIDEICWTSSGGTPSRSNNHFYNGDIPWIKTGELNDRYLDKTDEHISSDALTSSSTKKFPPNTVLFAMYGATIGKTCITSIEATTNQACCAFLPIQKNVIDPYFLQQYLILRRKLIVSLGEGAGQPNTSQDFMRAFQIAYPSYNEQVKISSILSKVDELIQKTDQVIEQTQRLKKGLMQRLLTKGIGHTKFRKIQFGQTYLTYDIPYSWNVVKLGKIASIAGRIGWKGLMSNEYVNNGPLMLSVWSLAEHEPYGVDYTVGVKRLSEFRYNESPEIKLQDGDVLLAKDGDIGRVGYVKKLVEPSTVNSHVVVVRTKSNLINSEFLYWFMKSKAFQGYCVAHTSGTTVPLLSQKDLRDALTVFPELVEQARISSILALISTQIQTSITYRSKLQVLKKGLMQKLLTGKIRVKV